MSIFAGPRAPDADGVTRRCVYKLPSSEHAAVFEAVRSKLPQPPFTTRRGRRISMIVSVFSVAMIVLILARSSRNHLILTWLMAAALACGVLDLMGDLRWNREKIFDSDSNALRDAWLAERHCPACAYPLAEHPRRPNHLHCPECGATWHSPSTLKPSP